MHEEKDPIFITPSGIGHLTLEWYERVILEKHAQELQRQKKAMELRDSKCKARQSNGKIYDQI